MNRRQLVNKFGFSLLLVSAVITSGVVLRAEDMPAVGNTAPSFTLNSQEGKRKPGGVPR